MADRITYRTGPWRFEWHGGRLADVYHLESDTALDCTQVSAGKALAPFTRTALKEAADDWVKESGADYLRELPYLM